MVQSNKTAFVLSVQGGFFCCCEFDMSSFSLPLSKLQLLTLCLSFLSPTGMKVMACVSQMSGRLGEDTLSVDLGSSAVIVTLVVDALRTAFLIAMSNYAMHII